MMPPAAATVLTRTTDHLLPVVNASFGRHVPESDAIKAFKQAVADWLVVSSNVQYVRILPQQILPQWGLGFQRMQEFRSA